VIAESASNIVFVDPAFYWHGPVGCETIQQAGRIVIDQERLKLRLAHESNAYRVQLPYLASEGVHLSLLLMPPFSEAQCEE
jgi:hypothetical protein